MKMVMLLFYMLGAKHFSDYVAFATIFFGPIISLLFFYDDNLLVQDELIFAAEMFFDIEIFIF